jgi:hypothetical protein
MSSRLFHVEHLSSAKVLEMAQGNVTRIAPLDRTLRDRSAPAVSRETTGFPRAALCRIIVPAPVPRDTSQVTEFK